MVQNWRHLKRPENVFWQIIYGSGHFRPIPATFHLTKIMKITRNIHFSKFDKSAGIGRNDDFCPEMCSLSPEEHICIDSRPYISICTFFRNFKKSIDFSPQKHRGKNEIGRFWLVKGSKQYHNYVGTSNILSCFLSYNGGCMVHLLHIHIRHFVFCQIH